MQRSNETLFEDIFISPGVNNALKIHHYTRPTGLLQDMESIINSYISTRAHHNPSTTIKRYIKVIKHHINCICVMSNL